MSELRVIALISGGKDSLFSILHCLKNGHQVVALANLYPEPQTHANHEPAAVHEDGGGGAGNDEDIDSNMYQTIGYGIVPLYAQALGLPLYREPIRGSAVSKSKSYQFVAPASGQEDETESLVPLLRRCIAAHPTANAVSTGAILSSYQRTRVESVALRLGLVPLSYLWQYPHLPPHTQHSLLEDMSSVGQDARIIKVASGGLDDRHLWMNVADSSVIRRLLRDMSRFAGDEIGAVLGEGGEYETLALDGPRPLWKYAIDIRDADRKVVAGGAGSVAVVIRSANLTEKVDDTSDDAGLLNLRIPSLLDPEYEQMLAELRKDTSPTQNPRGAEASTAMSDCSRVSTSVGSEHYMFNVSQPSAGTAGSQMEAIGTRMLQELHANELGPNQVVFTTLLLQSMSDFQEVNTIYRRLFTGPRPPARVTVACGQLLPDAVKISASFVTSSRPSDQIGGLHVQSRSYWAPANIGPYSQAITTPLGEPSENVEANRRIYVAGQVPLVPASLELVSEDFAQQAVLSLQHLWRIGREMTVHWWTHAIVFITASSAGDAAKKAATVTRLWRLAHARQAPREAGESDDEDIEHRSLHRSWASAHTKTGSLGATFRWPLPCWTSIKGADEEPDGQLLPAIAIVQIEQLPRGAQIEWTSTGVSSNEHIKTTGNGIQGTCSVGRQHVSLEVGDVSGTAARTTNGVAEVYTTKPLDRESALTGRARVVPCKRIFDGNGDSVEAVFVRTMEGKHA